MMGFRSQRTNEWTNELIGQPFKYFWSTGRTSPSEKHILTLDCCRYQKKVQTFIPNTYGGRSRYSEQGPWSMFNEAPKCSLNPWASHLPKLEDFVPFSCLWSTWACRIMFGHPGTRMLDRLLTLATSLRPLALRHSRKTPLMPLRAATAGRDASRLRFPIRCS